MIEVSAVALFLIGMAVGIIVGVFGVIVLALKYKGGTNGKEE